MAIVTDPEPFSEQPRHPAAQDAGVAGSVTDQWAEVYPPGGTDDAEPEAELPARTPMNGAGAVATVLFGVSVILVVVGSFMPFFQAVMLLDTAPSTNASVLSMDAWHLTSSSGDPAGPLPAHVEQAPVPLGYPLLAAALLIALVVLVRLRAVRRPDSERFAGALGFAGAAFLSGLVFAIGTFEIAWLALNSSAAIGPVREVVGSGYWLLVVAAVVSIIAAIIAYRRRPEPLPDSVGMAIVEGESEPEQPLVPPGQPPEWPVVAVIPTDERTNW